MLIIKRGRGEEEVGRKEDKERRWEGGERRGGETPAEYFLWISLLSKIK